MENKNSSWENPSNLDPRLRDHREYSYYLRRRFIALSAFNFVMVAIAIYGLLIIIEQTKVPPTVLVKTKSSGMFYGTPLSTPAVFSDPDYIDGILERILRIALHRSGKGPVDGAEHFLTAEALSQLNILYSSADENFGQKIEINTLPRILPEFSNTQQLAMYWKVEIFSRGLAGMQLSDIFLATFFVKGTPTTFNPSGWRLQSLTELSKDQFYEEEIQEEINKRTN